MKIFLLFAFIYSVLAFLYGFFIIFTTELKKSKYINGPMIVLASILMFTSSLSACFRMQKNEDFFYYEKDPVKYMILQGYISKEAKNIKVDDNDVFSYSIGDREFIVDLSEHTPSHRK